MSQLTINTDFSDFNLPDEHYIDQIFSQLPININTLDNSIPSNHHQHTIVVSKLRWIIQHLLLKIRYKTVVK